MSFSIETRMPRVFLFACLLFNRYSICMCGIAGIYKYGGGEVLEADLTLMRDSLIHRGPDGAGNYVSPDLKAGLAQRRLAIIDLTPAAGCPMANEDGTVWITFNGEIYNFKELRAELLAKGHALKTHGDTETILHGYEEWGVDVVKRLNGMFAFAIWDEKKQQLFAARDQVGVKPFYYAMQNGVFYFGSEIKAILAHPDFKQELDEPNIGYYLTFSAMPAPYTLFKDVRKLPAAHALTIDATGEVKTWEYWNPLKSVSVVSRDNTEAFYVGSLRELLGKSIRAQMVSDVPFGCFLSGGIDSSLNAALMSNALGKPVETFSIGTAGAAKYNEFEYSRLVADHLNAKRHERVITFGDFLDFLPEYGKFADDPNGDQTCFLVFYLSELVRQSGVTVVQTGEGGDELFAGYETYEKAARLYPYWQALSYLPQPLLRLLHAVVEHLPFSDFAKEYSARLARGQAPFWGHAIAFASLEKQKLLAPKYRNDPAWNSEYEVIGKYYREVIEHAPDSGILTRISYLELKMRLADFLLMRVDKMGMAHSIEARVPFLDPRIVELALQIPESMHLKGGELKHILKKAARGTIPDEIIDRKKQGFGAPLEEWFRDGATAKPLLDKIYNSKLVGRKLFDYDYVHDLAARHQAGENHTFRLVNLLTLSLWYDYWF
jgi:asparagine synthase (glutamine-hydrolysing)